MAAKKKTKSTDSVRLAEAIEKLAVALKETETTQIFIATDRTTQYQLANAPDAFGLIFDLLWDDFYREFIKDGDQENKLKTPADALEAYRAHIIELLEKYGLDIERGWN